MNVRRYESRLAKRDEALAIQNKVAAEQTVNWIEARFGPVEQDEIEFYRKRLTENGTALINYFQMQLIGYLYYKDFGDTLTFRGIRNTTDYIKLIVCAKRMLSNLGMVLLPYIMSSKVVRQPTRRIISKKDVTKYERHPLYESIRLKYNNNEKMIKKVWEFIGMVASSTFQIIDYDPVNHTSGQYDHQNVPMVNDIIYEEMMFFIASI